MSRPLLLPVDGSSSAESAREHAFALSQRFGAPLIAIYVVDTTIARRALVKESFAQYGEQLLARIRSAGAEIGLAIETEVREGIPYEKILSYANERNVRAIVMGTHGRTGADRLVLGSVTERVVRLSDVSVLTVGAQDGDPPKTNYESILVPTDGSETATEALEPAIELATMYDARVHILSVIESGYPEFETISGVDTETRREHGRDAVEMLESHARTAGLSDVTTAIREGRPADEVLAYCEAQRIDCIVMCTHGRTGLRRHLLGSTTERVLRGTTRPVLCIPLGGSSELTDDE